MPLEASLDWAAATSSSDPCNPSRRLTAVRGFLSWLSGRDGATDVPPPGLLGPAGHRKPPHVYSDQEIMDLMHAAEGLGPVGWLRPHACTTLFGLIACTGLRISEALALTCGDVDLHHGVITVRAGKGGRVRLVPLHQTALAPLRAYVTVRCRLVGWPEDSDAFFRTDDSSRISYNAAHGTFTVLRRQLGWTPAGRTRVPRVHDLRHRMIVRRIQAWHAQGADTDAKMAVLATYVGHREVRNLYWYVSAVPELMTIIASRLEDYASPDAAGAS